MQDRGIRSGHLAALLLVLTVGCGGARSARDDIALRHETGAPSSDERPHLEPLSGELGALAEEMILETQGLRRLLFKEPLEVLKGTPEAISWLLRREIEEMRASGDLSMQEVTLEAFGFIAPDDSYEALMLDLYEEQVTGVYNHREKLLLVMPPQSQLDISVQDDEDAEVDPEAMLFRLQVSMFLVHEMVHALQDQHFGLKRFLDETATFDESKAARALVEGDATYTMYEFLFQSMGMSLSDLPDLGPIITNMMKEIEGPEHESLMQAPLYVRETLLFPYLAGFSFVHALHELGGWEAVNDAFEAPPTTSQQILQFDRYVKGVGGEKLSIPRPTTLLEAGYELVAEGSLGELGLRLFLAEHGGGSPGPGAACGWAGDTYAIYSKEGETALALWLISFGDEEAATRFIDETESSFSSSTKIHVRRLEPDLVGVVTNLDQPFADQVMEHTRGLRREPPSITPFSPTSSEPGGAAEG